HHGLLHQGSVAVGGRHVDFHRRAEILAGCLAQEWEPSAFFPPQDTIARMIAARYGRTAWTQRR
ncbi:MAG: hypothetical protein WCS43_13560, partial [Verrucomicrobiota bacterium]